MSEKYGIVNCNLCERDFKKYDKKKSGQIFGISLARSSTWSLTLKFVDIDKSEIDKHLCSYCIADIVNKFET